MKNRSLSLFTVWIALFAYSSNAQDIQVSLNEENRFLITGKADVIGLDFRSELGALDPSPGTDATPFNFFLANTPNQITYGNLGATVPIDGTLTLNAGWNPIVPNDIQWSYGEGPVVVGPFGLDGGNPFAVVVDRTDYRFWLRGSDLQLSALQLDSAGGSLVGGTNPAPFSSFGANTPNQIELLANSPVTVDGSLKLNAGWDPTRERDVTYSYEQVGGTEQLGPFSVLTFPATPTPVRVRIDEDDTRFVLNGNGQRVSQFQFDSPSGSLMRAETPLPFTSLQENTNNRIAFSSDSSVSLDGSLKLSAGWDPFKPADVSFSYNQVGVPNPFGPFTDIGSYPDAPPATLGLSDDFHFVMRGQGQVVQGLTIRSSSLVPTDDPTPFATVDTPTVRLLELQGGPVTIDGEVKLAAAWDRNQGSRDVLYSYSGETQLRVLNPSEYPVRAPIRNIGVTINDDHKFVLTGNGNELRQVAFRSSSRSITPAVSAEPFNQLVVNSPSSVQFASSSFVTLDGALTLSAGYNPQVAGEDVVVAIQEVGDFGLRFGSRILDYPPATPRVQVALNRENRFVLTGRGEQLLGFELRSESGSLVPGNNLEPFQIALSNTPTHLAYGVLGVENAVTLDGSITLTSSWNPLGSPDVDYSYGLIGGGLVGPTKLFQEPPAELDVVRVSLNDEFRWVLNGNGEELEQFDLWSERGGLIPAEAPEPFSALTLNDENSIRFETGGNVTVDGSLALSAGWDFDLGIRDVRYWYREEGQDLNAGPFVVPDPVYPPRPAASRVDVRIDDNDRKFVLHGEGHLLRTFELNSPSGSLIPAETSAPFEGLAENSTNRVAYEMPTHVVLDGTLKLNSGYDLDVAGEDVSYKYQQLGHRTLRGPFDVPQSEYPPNPRKSPLRVEINDDLQIVVRGIGQPVTNLTFDSPGGSLATTSDDPAPFDEFLADTPEQVTLGSLGLVRIDGTLTLPISWTETAADVEFVYQLEGTDEEFGPTRIAARDYPSPNLVNVAVSTSGGSIAFFGNGQLINGFEVTSDSGALEHIPVGDFAPFDVAVDLTANTAKFTSENPIPVNWVRLPFLKWNSNVGSDLQFTFDSAGPRAIVAQLDFVSPVVPEPSGFALAGIGVCVLLSTRRRNSRS